MGRRPSFAYSHSGMSWFGNGASVASKSMDTRQMSNLFPIYCTMKHSMTLVFSYCVKCPYHMIIRLNTAKPWEMHTLNAMKCALTSFPCTPD